MLAMLRNVFEKIETKKVYGMDNLSSKLLKMKLKLARVKPIFKKR